MSKLTTFVCEYKILPDHATRENCMTFFGGMTQEDDLRELGEVKLLSRWSCVGEARGFCVAQAENNVVMQKWLNNWVSMADIKVVSCLDDNQHRAMILKRDPDYLVSYDKVGNDAIEGESLYFIKYQFKEGLRSKGFEVFANMSQEMDEGDTGSCTSYGRWHVPSQGYGFAIASCPSAADAYKWAFNWDAMCDVELMPVTGDNDTREIIKQGLGFKVKHAQLMEHMKKLMEGPCFINAKFVFKGVAEKTKFLEILNGDEGLRVTREWPGCESFECFESHENNLEVNIRQKWQKESDHASYMEMRKQTGLFASVMEMLSSPLEVTHLNPLDC